MRIQVLYLDSSEASLCFLFKLFNEHGNVERCVRHELLFAHHYASTSERGVATVYRLHNSPGASGSELLASSLSEMH